MCVEELHESDQSIQFTERALTIPPLKSVYWSVTTEVLSYVGQNNTSLPETRTKLRDERDEILRIIQNLFPETENQNGTWGMYYIGWDTCLWLEPFFFNSVKYTHYECTHSKSLQYTSFENNVLCLIRDIILFSHL